MLSLSGSLTQQNYILLLAHENTTTKPKACLVFKNTLQHTCLIRGQAKSRLKRLRQDTSHIGLFSPICCVNVCKKRWHLSIRSGLIQNWLLLMRKGTNRKLVVTISIFTRWRHLYTVIRRERKCRCSHEAFQCVCVFELLISHQLRCCCVKL